MLVPILLRWIVFTSFLIVSTAALMTNEPFTCTWKTPDGRVIDLNPLSTGTSPRFKQSHNDGTVTRDYTWDPCRDVPCGGRPGVAACQISLGIPNSVYYAIGDRNTATLMQDSSGIYLKYTVSDSSRSTKVYLKCNPGLTEPVYTADGEVPPGGVTYELKLQASEVCPNSSGGGLSAGSILLIIFFVLLIIYFVAGILVNRFARHESGTNLCPNKAFWLGLPGLIHDGVLFLFRRGRMDGYQHI